MNNAAFIGMIAEKYAAAVVRIVQVESESGFAIDATFTVTYRKVARDAFAAHMGYPMSMRINYPSLDKLASDVHFVVSVLAGEPDNSRRG